MMAAAAFKAVTEQRAVFCNRQWAPTPTPPSLSAGWLAPFVLGFGRENYGRLAQSSIATQFLNYDEINPVPCKAS